MPLLACAAAALWVGRLDAQADVALRYRVRAWPEGLTLGLTAAAAAAPYVLAERLPHARCAPCDPSRLRFPDRGAIGPLRRAPKRWSDVGLAGTVAGAAALLVGVSPRGSAGEDAAVFAQAQGLSLAATNWLKVLAHRPRPFLYVDGATPGRPDDGLSFPSGHASATFAAAAAYASIQERRGRLGERSAEAASLFGAAALTGALRVMARKHFPTDVLAGALLGTAAGWLVPQVAAVR